MIDRFTGCATILVVDDERGPRESLRMILSPSYQVLLAEDGDAALEILRSTPIDLVTVDLNMPGMRGQDLMRRVRGDFPNVEVIVITGHGDMESATDGIRFGICDYLNKPFDVVQVTAAVYRALARRRGRGRLVGFLETLGDLVGRDTDVFQVLAELESNATLQGRLGEVLARSAEEVLPDRAADPERALPFFEVLAQVVESQDHYLQGHGRRVALYAELLGDQLCLRDAETRQLRLASFLHDIGKIAVPAELLLRAGPLDPGERKVVMQHASIGARLLEPLGVDGALVRVVRHHHERWDGSGYPDGLDGESIPLVARIVHIADAFEAMTSERPYRDTLSTERALAELDRCAGSQFDPTLVKEFLVLVESGASDVDIDVVADAVASAATGFGFRNEGTGKPESAGPSAHNNK